jgi:hypothetical protein
MLKLHIKNGSQKSEDKNTLEYIINFKTHSIEALIHIFERHNKYIFKKLWKEINLMFCISAIVL